MILTTTLSAGVCIETCNLLPETLSERKELTANAFLHYMNQQ